MDRQELFRELEEKVVRPTTVVMQKLRADTPPGPVDVAFLFGRSFGDDDDELFALAADLVTNGRARHILINGSEGERFGGTKPREAWAGKTAWIERLKGFGLHDVLTSRPAFHARDEHEAFLDVAVANGWKSAVLLTQPTQTLRFMLGQHKACIDRSYPMRLYAAFPRREDWEEAVHGSQGTAELPRWVHTVLDVLRVVPYWYKGDIASPAELLEYLERREETK